MKNNYRNILIEKRNELTSTLPTRDSIAIERLPDMIDDVQSSSQRELALVSINRHWKQVRSIDEALQRIETGGYGICAACEEPINPKRLSAVPWAILCRDCQELKDAEEGGSPAAFAAA
ncbi:MAG: TraR/DksA family transcriptional regulator [Acidobacteriota bacterium]